MRRTPVYAHPGFRTVSEHYAAELLRRNPIAASWLGEHAYDGLLPETGAEAQEREIAFLRELRDAFAALPERELSLDERLDRAVMLQLARTQLFMQEDLHRWKLGADLARSLGDAIFVLFSRDFAPLALRMESIVARLKSAPIYLRAGRALFQQVPAFWCDIFIESAERLPALLDTIEQSVAKRIPKTLFDEYRKASRQAKEAIEAHLHWFRQAIAPKAQGKWALGPASFQALLQVRELGMTSAELLELGESTLKRAHGRIEASARRLSPTHSREEAHLKVREKAPRTFEQALDAYRDAVSRSRFFVERTNFATLPSDEALEIIETPDYLSHLIPFAAYLPPERTARPQRGTYLVSRPPVSEGLGRHNYADIGNTSIHEGYPGHHLQFSAQNLHPSKVRVFADSIELIEGWAHYCEEEAKRLGFETGEENVFVQAVDEAWRAARVLIDVNIQQGTWTVDQAVDCLVKNANMNKDAAEAELRWYSQSPGYPLSYLTGKHLLFTLKDDLRRNFGSDFSDRAFHDLVIYEGSLPVFLARRFYPEMLREQLKTGTPRVSEADRPDGNEPDIIMVFKRNLFVPDKHEYIRGGKRPQADCILCGILTGDPAVESLLVWQNDLLALSVNLYPYNSGHLLLFPKRHLRDPREMSEAEERGMSRLNRHCMDALDRLYHPLGYNLGFNIGDASGASIDHLHQHLVPRYVKELGFVDIITGSKIIIENPTLTMERLKQAFREHPIDL